MCRIQSFCRIKVLLFWIKVDQSIIIIILWLADLVHLKGFLTAVGKSLVLLSKWSGGWHVTSLCRPLLLSSAWHQWSSSEKQALQLARSSPSTAQCRCVFVLAYTSARQPRKLCILIIKILFSGSKYPKNVSAKNAVEMLKPYLLYSQHVTFRTPPETGEHSNNVVNFRYLTEKLDLTQTRASIFSNLGQRPLQTPLFFLSFIEYLASQLYPSAFRFWNMAWYVFHTRYDWFHS